MAEKIVFDLMKEMSLFKSRYRHAKLKLNGYTHFEFMTILKIQELSEQNTTVTPSVLSDYFQCSRPALTQILNNLEKNEYIERKFMKGDRRKVELTITKKGEMLIAENFKEYINNFSKITDIIGIDDSETLLRILKKINESYYQ